MNAGGGAPVLTQVQMGGKLGEGAKPGKVKGMCAIVSVQRFVGGERRPGSRLGGEETNMKCSLG